MAALPDFCPACNAFVRFGWTTNCGACGASLTAPPAVQQPPAQAGQQPWSAPPQQTQAPKKKASPKIIAAAAVGTAVLLIGGAAAALTLSTPPANNSAALASSANDSSTSTTAASSTTTAAPTTTTAQPAGPQIKLIDSVQTTQSATSCDIALTMSGTGTADGDTFNATATGAFDFSKQRGTETMSLTQPGAANIALTTILDGTTVYEKLPADLSLDPSKPWVKMNLSDISDGTDSSLDALTTGQSTDPTQGLSMLLAASDQVTTVGPETLRGTPTTHYKVSLDFKTAAANTTDAARKAALQQFAQIYTKAVPVDVWLDSSNRIRKISYKIDASQLAGSTDSGTMTFTLELYNFGTSVSITVPPASQVTDLSDLGNSLGGGTSTSTTVEKVGSTKA